MDDNEGRPEFSDSLRIYSGNVSYPSYLVAQFMALEMVLESRPNPKAADLAADGTEAEVLMAAGFSHGFDDVFGAGVTKSLFRGYQTWNGGTKQ